jgi:hypothetical protein
MAQWVTCRRKSEGRRIWIDPDRVRRLHRSEDDTFAYLSGVQDGYDSLVRFLEHPEQIFFCF